MVKKKKTFWKILIVILLCIFCTTSFVGCIGSVGSGSGGSSGGGSSSSGSGGSSGGSSSGSGSSGGSGGSSSGGSGGSGGSSYESEYDINDLLMGAICVYDVDGDENVFYDKYKGRKVSFNELVDRQYTALATYIYYSLVKIYGTGDSNSSFAISGYNGDSSSNVSYSDILSSDNSYINIALYRNHGNSLYFGDAMVGNIVLTVEEDGDDVSIAYQEYTNSEDMPWYDGVTLDHWDFDLGSNSSYAIEMIADHLKLIFNNPLILNMNDTIGNVFTFDNVALMNSIKNTITNGTIDESNIQYVGLSKICEWSIAYYIAYYLIGNETFTGSTLTEVKNLVNPGNFISRYKEANATKRKELVNAFNKYKAYDVIIPEIASSAISAVVSSTNNSIILTKYSNDYPHVGSNSANPKLDYYDGSNWLMTLYPKLTRNSYVYLDDVTKICDAKDLSVDSKGEYIEDAPDGVENGDPKRLKQIIVLPYIDNTKYKKDTFQLGGFVAGFESTGGFVESLVLVDIKYSAVFNDGTSIDNSRVYFDDSAYEDDEENDVHSVIVHDKIDIHKTFTFSESTVDVMFFEIDDVNDKIPSQYSFGNVKFADYAVGSEQTFINDTFHDVEHYTAPNGIEYDIRCINVYNTLIKSNGLGLESNYLFINFDYYRYDNQPLDYTPSIYIQFFEIYDM